jgi:hypothetical protein
MHKRSAVQVRAILVMVVMGLLFFTAGWIYNFRATWMRRLEFTRRPRDPEGFRKKASVLAASAHVGF